MSQSPRQDWSPSRRKLPEKPRRVQGGIKLPKDQERPHGWAGQRLLRLMEQAAAPAATAEGLEYALAGQTRQMDIEPGLVKALVQGRAPRAYRVALRLDTFSAEQWREAAAEVAGHPSQLANLLAGQVQRDIEDVFGRVNRRLAAAEPGDIEPSCNCDDDAPWCKHVCCAVQLVAERLDEDPRLAFLMRGLKFDEFMDRLRTQRTLEASVTGLAPVFIHRPPRGVEEPPPPLDSEIDRFWRAGPELEQIDTSPRPPKVRHPMLRRLGSSPFEGAKFPLVGLLATCYDLISQRWREGAEIAAASPATVDTEDPSEVEASAEP